MAALGTWASRRVDGCDVWFAPFERGCAAAGGAAVGVDVEGGDGFQVEVGDVGCVDVCAGVDCGEVGGDWVAVDADCGAVCGEGLEVAADAAAEVGDRPGPGYSPGSLGEA